MSKKKPYILEKDVCISNIIKDCPEAMQLLATYGLLCINCPFNQFETLEKGAKAHRMNEKQIEKMIKEINEQLKIEK